MNRPGTLRAVPDRSRRDEQQDLPAGLQGVDGRRVPRAAHLDVLRRGRRGPIGIDPDLPVVGERRPLERDGHGQPDRRAHLGQGHGNGTECGGTARRDVLAGKLTRCDQMPAVICDAPHRQGIHEGRGAEVGDLRVGSERFAGGEGPFLHAQQRHGRAAVAAEGFRGGQALGVPEGVEHADEGGAGAGVVVEVEQLEAGIARGPQHQLDLLLVEQDAE